MSTISVALGPERTRNELLPYIIDLVDDFEEVKCALATVLGSLLSCVGGAAFADHILKTLEKLAASEELSVREKVSRIFC